MTDLEAEQINYLMRAFSIVSSLIESGQIDSSVKKQIADFMPRMLEKSESELYRSKIGDVVTLIQGYSALYEANVLSKEDHSKAHRACQSYLNEYMSKAKRTISGKEFADLLKCIGEAKVKGVFEYSEETTQSMEKEFF